MKKIGSDKSETSFLMDNDNRIVTIRHVIELDIMDKIWVQRLFSSSHCLKRFLLGIKIAHKYQYRMTHFSQSGGLFSVLIKTKRDMLHILFSVGECNFRALRAQFKERGGKF